MKTIVVEALSALQGGGQTYIKNLCAHYSNYPDTQVYLLVPHGLAKGIPDTDGISVVVPEFATKGVLHRFVWNKVCLPRFLRRVNANVLYCTGGSIATRHVGTCRLVVAFRNMLPFMPSERKRFPLGYIRIRLWLLRMIQGSSFQDADLVVYISNFAKSIIEQSIPKITGQSVVIPHGISDFFLMPQLPPQNINLPDGYVLYVSILDFYKAQVEVVVAWAKLREKRKTNEKLLLIGPEYPPYGNKVRQTIAQYGLQDEVLLLGSVPYNDLPAYYQHAKVNIFASSCENCPNILLEMLAAGRPVLCSNYLPMPEFGGDAVEYFNPYKPDELAFSLQSVLDDHAKIQTMGKLARQRAEKYSWKVSAARTWDVLHNLAMVA